ncbi:hypothetical protein A2U01_0025499, partial [Trifolium medium]|nr:hypothetical protein [Trifolium medium]
MVRPAGSIEGEPVMLEKVIPIFDGTGEAYWWLIQLDRYFQANSWILEKMKVDWVTLFALRGDAYMWWSSWKQGNQNVTWETFERAFIKKFIPDLWEMIEAAESEEQESHDHVMIEIAEESKDGRDAEEEKDSGSLQNLSGLVPEPSNQKLQSNKESVGKSKKIEAEIREVSIKEKHKVVVDTPSPPSRDAPPPDIEFYVVGRDETKEKDRGVDPELGQIPDPINHHQLAKEGIPSKSISVFDSAVKPRPPEAPDLGESVMARPRRVPPPRPPDLLEFVDGERYKAVSRWKKGKEQTAWDGLPLT